ncbi:MAG: hypothetical protein K1X75_02080 [Leptospirales bacterium]|nr:hypothetical protein [Leptospirales bacterium]
MQQSIRSYISGRSDIRAGGCSGGVALGVLLAALDLFWIQMSTLQR